MAPYAGHLPNSVPWRRSSGSVAKHPLAVWLHRIMAKPGMTALRQSRPPCIQTGKVLLAEQIHLSRLLRFDVEDWCGWR